MNNSWYVYILECEGGFLYTGIAVDVEKRFQEHLSSKKGAKFCKIHKPIKIVYKQSVKNRSEACKREFEIKSLTKDKKIKLIYGRALKSNSLKPKIYSKNVNNC